VSVTLQLIGCSAIVVGVVGQIYRRTLLPLKTLAWTITIGLCVVWVVSH